MVTKESFFLEKVSKEEWSFPEGIHWHGNMKGREVSEKKISKGGGGSFS